MKLYLSSYKFGDHIGQLDMLMEGYPKKALIIANSADQFPEDGIAERVNQDIDFFESRGISASSLDLRDYFGSNTPDTLEKELRSAGLLWFRGGNVFVLRRALRQSQLDKLLP